MFGECHLLSASGMSECNLHCVQAQTFVWFASVEKISDYRSGKTVDVCGVYAELVGASALGIVGDTGAKMLLFIDEMGGDT